MRTRPQSGQSVRGDRLTSGAMPLWCLALALSTVAHANMGRLDTDPSIDGQILPRQETTIEVAWETLDIRFAHAYFRSKPDYSFRGVAPRAFVKAQYQLHNPADRRIDLALAFPVIAGDLRRDAGSGPPIPQLGGSPKGVSFAVSVNGKAIRFEAVTCEALMGDEVPKWRDAILAWMKSDSFIADLLQKGQTTGQDRTALREYLSKRKGFTPRQATDLDNHLLAGRKPSLPGKWDDGYVCYLFHCLHPGARTRIATAFEKWRADFRYIDPHSGALYDAAGRLGFGSGHRLERKISFATFRVTLGPREKARLQVEYDHLINANHERSLRQNRPEYQFQYILRTAGLWSKFGPIAIRVAVPEHLKAAFSRPLEYDGLRDGFMVFKARVGKPQANLLVGLSPQLKNADFAETQSANLMCRCLGWLRRYHDDPTGPWADDYLMEYAMTMEALRRGGNFETYRKTKQGAETATDDEWAFLVGKTPLELYRTIAERFRDTNGGHRAALMLLELKYRDAAFDAATYESVESDAQRFIEERPSGWLTPNAWYLVAVCRMRSDLRAADAAFQSAATPRAHWYVREQAEWFSRLLRKAERKDEGLLRAWAKCEVRNAFKHDYMRRDYLRGRYVFPMNHSNGLDEYWQAYCAHRDRPLSYELLKRLCLELDRCRHSPARREKRDALAELYRRAAREEKDAETLRRLRLQVLDRLSGIGVGHAVDVVLEAVYSHDEQVSPVAVRVLRSADDKAKVKATLTQLAQSGEAGMSAEAAIQLGQMGERSAIPHLIKLLRHQDRQLAYRACALLRKITRQTFSFKAVNDPPEQREKVIQQWERWWARTRPWPGM